MSQNLEWTLKRLNQEDIDFLLVIRDQGPKTNELINRTRIFILALKRCKARGLVVPVKRRTTYYYDLTEQGREVLKAIGKPLSAQLPRS